MRMQRPMMVKNGGIKSQTMRPSSAQSTTATFKKRSPKSTLLVPIDVTTLLFLALLVRALLLLSFTPWFVSVKSFELKNHVSINTREM